MQTCGVEYEEQFGGKEVFFLLKRRNCFDSERRGRSGKSEKIRREIVAGVGDRPFVVRTEEFFGGGKDEAGQPHGQSALFEHPKKAQPYAVDRKQGDGEGERLFSARDERREKSGGIGKEKDRR